MAIQRFAEYSIITIILLTQTLSEFINADVLVQQMKTWIHFTLNIVLSAGRWRVRHGAELRDPGRGEHPPHAGASRSLSRSPSGQCHTLWTDGHSSELAIVVPCHLNQSRFCQFEKFDINNTYKSYWLMYRKPLKRIPLSQITFYLVGSGTGWRYCSNLETIISCKPQILI